MVFRVVRAGVIPMAVALAGCGGAAAEPARPPHAPPSAASGVVQAPAATTPVVRVPDPPADPPSLDTAPDQQTNQPGWIGVELAALPAGEAGVLVRSVVPGSPAEAVGLAGGDRILGVEGQSVQQPADVVALVGAHAAGSRIALAVRRGAQDRLFAVRLGAKPDTQKLMRMSYVGRPAPSLEALKVAQGSVTPTLAALRGKVVVVEFWATWCVVCRVMAPTMESWEKRYAGQGVELLGITTEPVDKAAMAAGQLGMTYAIASDESGRTTEAYRALALPTLFIIDRHGTVRDVLVGYSSDRLQQMQALLDRLVAEPI